MSCPEGVSALFGALRQSRRFSSFSGGFAV
jgi:hypothetical protein